MNYYTYTIHFVDGYYYHGYHKQEEVDPLTDGYFGSPVTHKEKWLTTMHWKEVTGFYEAIEEVTFAEQEKIRPVFNIDPYCLNANCNGVIPSELARKGAVKAGRKAGEYHKKNKTAVCDPTNQEKGRQKTREEGKGFYSPEFQTSPEMAKVRKRNGEKRGSVAVASGQLAQARACINKDNQRKVGTENLKKAHAKARKPVKVVTPSGDFLIFESLKEASQTLNLDPKRLSLVARGQQHSIKGHYAHYL